MWGRRARWQSNGDDRRREPPAPIGADGFGLVLLFYQREPVYALGLALLAAYARQTFPDIRIHLVPVVPDDDPGKIGTIVDGLRPSLVAASAMSLTWRPLVPHLAEIKRRWPAVPILIGGYQAIVEPAGTLAHGAVDLVCVGDGEQPLVDLIRRLRGGADGTPIAGLWEKRRDGQVWTAPPALVRDLSELPFPDYRIFERDGSIAYLKPNAIEAKSVTSVPVISGRGCPYRCTYCANTTLLDLYGSKGGLLRKYDPEPLVAEMRRVRDHYGVEFFQFWDEEFFYDARRATALLERYAASVGAPFSMFVRVENMTAELCAFAAASGCHSMWFGLESGSESYRRRYLNRRMSDARLIAAAATARRHGIKLLAFAMVGMPFESRADVEATLALCRAIDPELTVVSQFVPLPGTPLYALCREHDLLLDAETDPQMWPLGTLNIREHAGGMTAAEMREVGAVLMDYLRQSSRFDDV